jgi:hypothetical protein
MMEARRFGLWLAELHELAEALAGVDPEAAELSSGKSPSTSRRAGADTPTGGRKDSRRARRPLGEDWGRHRP